MLASVEKLALRRASSCVCIFSLEPLKLLHELLRCIALTLRGLPSKGASTHQESFRLSCGAALRRAVSARYTVENRAQSSSARESEARTRCLPHRSTGTGTLLCNTSYYISTGTWVWIPVIVQLYKYEYLYYLLTIYLPRGGVLCCAVVGERTCTGTPVSGGCVGRVGFVPSLVSTYLPADVFRSTHCCRRAVPSPCMARAAVDTLFT